MAHHRWWVAILCSRKRWNYSLLTSVSTTSIDFSNLSSKHRAKPWTRKWENVATRHDSWSLITPLREIRSGKKKLKLKRKYHSWSFTALKHYLISAFFVTTLPAVFKNIILLMLLLRERNLNYFWPKTWNRFQVYQTVTVTMTGRLLTCYFTYQSVWYIYNAPELWRR